MFNHPPIDVVELGKLACRTNSYKRRAEATDNYIRRMLEDRTGVYVSSSFGKDSVVLLHLLLQHKPDIPVLFINSNYCFPDTYLVRDKFRENFSINLHEIQQPNDYIEIIEKYGLPEERTKNQQKKVVDLLKKNLADVWAHENNLDFCFWGLRKEESRGRMAFMNARGKLFYNQTRKLHFCAPLADWKWEDIWAYIVQHDVPFSEIYRKTMYCDPRRIRNTSWITTDGALKSGRIQWLRHYYPEYYERLAEIAPRIKRYA